MPNLEQSEGSETTDLRSLLKVELAEVHSERTKVLQSLNKRAETLDSERSVSQKRFNEKVEALENLLKVLDRQVEANTPFLG